MQEISFILAQCSIEAKPPQSIYLDESNFLYNKYFLTDSFVVGTMLCIGEKRVSKKYMVVFDTTEF